jgi:hypothetical protein
MLKNLVKVANKLDSIGLSKEADLLDSIIKKEATRVLGAESWFQRFLDLLEDRYGFTFDGDIIIMDGGESFLTPATTSEAAEVLTNLGMSNEEISEVLSPEREIFPEPPVDIEDVKAAFISQFKESRDLDALKVDSIEWNNGPSDYPHYIVKAMGTYRPFTYRADDYFRDEPTGKSNKQKEYPMHVEFMLMPEGDTAGTPVEGSDGKTYNFYGED